MKKFFVTICIAFALVALTTNAWAFHDGGVADCKGCHTMHNSENGAAIDTAHANGNAKLLIRATPSEVCLSCHASGHGAQWGSNPLVPPAERGGGNFCYTNAANLNDGYGGATNPIPGSYGVHSIIAPSYGGTQDPMLSHAPGGTYPASAMSCTSCHDPHGNANFRLLYGVGHVSAGNYDFVNPAPVATGISLNGSTGESKTNHTAYKGGMSAWCANCHGAYHNSYAAGKLFHPSGVPMTGGTTTVYGLYAGTGQPDGDPAHAYIPQVPFEDAGMTISSDAGPTALSQVSCVTCHRAHGSSAPNLGRWDFNITTWAAEGVASGSYAIPNPYAATAGNAQRSLCNKCHGKD